jgi:hypothetical protein
MRLVSRRNRWWLFLAVVGAIGFFAWLFLFPSELLRNLERVQDGMTLTEVVAILGQPDTRIDLSDSRTGNSPSPVWMATWFTDEDVGSVIFGRDGRVVGKQWYGLSIRERMRELWWKQFGRSAPF